ncbi:MAG: septum formation initiator family protein [bacterium]
MKSFQQKKGLRNILYSRPVLVLLIILIFLFSYFLFGFMGKMELTMENRKIAENKVVQLKEQKERLVSDISKLNSNNGVEESIRDKFGLAKEGEGIVVIIDNKTEPKVVKEESGGFFSFLKNLFK